MPYSAGPIAIWEPAFGGHHLFYVRVVAQQLISSGLRPIWIHDGRAIESGDYPNQLKSLVDAGELGTAEVEQGATLRVVLRSAERIQSQRTLLLDGDALLQRLATTRIPVGMRVTVLVTRDPALDQRRDALSRSRMVYKSGLMAMLNARRSRVDVAILDSPYLPASGGNRHLGRTVPDPVVLEASAEAVEGFRSCHLSADRVWLVIAGALSRRKRVGLALEAIAALDPRKYGLLLAGTIDEDYRRELITQASMPALHGLIIEWISRPLSNQEMSITIAAADASLVLYETPNPPSSLGKGLAAGTLTIVAGPEPLRRNARRFPESAWECDPTPAAVAHLLGKLQPATRVPAQVLPGPDDFVRSLLPVDELRRGSNES